MSTEQQKVAEFNARCGISTLVQYRLGPSFGWERARTRSHAFVFGEFAASIYVEGCKNRVSLDQVIVIREENAT